MTALSEAIENDSLDSVSLLMKALKKKKEKVKLILFSSHLSSTREHTYTCVRVFCVCMCMHTRVCMGACMHARTHARMHMHTQNTHTHTYTHYCNIPPTSPQTFYVCMQGRWGGGGGGGGGDKRGKAL